MSVAGSGVCKLTNQSRSGITKAGLKETGAKTEPLTYGDAVR